MSEIFSLEGKKGLIIGIANKQSIALGCARMMKAAGAELAITYLNERSDKYVRPFAEELEAPIYMPCDVQQPGELEAVFEEIEKKWGKLDFLVHSIAFASKDDLHGRLVDCSLEGFQLAMDVSCHSLMRMTRLAEPLMKDGGSILSMSYLGSERAVENYGAMGPVKAALESSTRYMAHELREKNIRVNCVSPGPIKTRAASGIKDFSELLGSVGDKIPNYNVTPEDVGAISTFLVTDAAKAFTGYVYYVDEGYSTLG